MSEILIYCRPGYEVDAANEITHLATEQGRFGFSRFTSGCGYIVFSFYTDPDALLFAKANPVQSLVFTRQLVVVLSKLTLEDKQDRISPVLGAVAQESYRFGNVWVEYPESDEGRTLAKFCRKFSVPLRQHMRKKELLTKKINYISPCLHAFFIDFETCYLGVSFSSQRAPFENGICRLKFPSDAPSRSTLKLEEAINTMLTHEQVAEVFRTGARAVDLGACPGGWTYQLTSRGMSVEAVDNGKMADNLMATGLVDYRPEDGFHYKPQFGHVELLVCDMIEQPDRVANLMSKWLCLNWANHAIFNLKLPMKRRFESVMAAKGQMQKDLMDAGIKATMTIRHLYHDRDEVTVAIIRGQ
jgi:23S rRNA (cytidine2498-2'-O)-methyltransferase